MAYRDRFGLHDEMGVGKTATTIRALDLALAERIMLIVPAMLRQNWLHEFKRFSVYDRKIVKAKNIHDYIAWKRRRFDVLVCSYEHATSWAKDINEACAYDIDAMPIDEAHYLKNEKSQRTEAILGKDGEEGIIKFADHAWHVTGTPLANDPLDVYTFLRFAKAIDDMPSAQFVKYFFERRITTYGARHFIKDDMLPVLQQLLRNNSVHRTHQDVGMQLPPIWMKEVIIDGDTIDIDQFVKSYPYVEELIIKAIETNDLDVLDIAYIATIRRLVGKAKAVPYANMLKMELDGGAKKRVAFFIHTEPLLMVKRTLEKHGYRVVVAYGETREQERQEAVRSFMEDDSVDVFLGNMKVAGVGLTLTASSEIDVVESDWSPSNNAQAIKRVHRYGQTRDVHARFITLADSIDEIVNRIVAEKTAAIAQIEGSAMNAAPLDALRRSS